jgi:hypothetical protein
MKLREFRGRSGRGALQYAATLLPLTCDAARTFFWQTADG